MQLEFQEVTNDALERVPVRLVRLERGVGAVEAPRTPRIDPSSGGPHFRTFRLATRVPTLPKLSAIETLIR